MSTALATKLHVARMAAIAAFNEAIKERAGQDALALLQAAIDRLNEAEKLRQQAKK
jgi:hypothetical protein